MVLCFSSIQGRITIPPPQIFCLFVRGRTQSAFFNGEERKCAACRFRYANILLKVDEEGRWWTDKNVAAAFGWDFSTVADVHRRLVERDWKESRRKDHLANVFSVVKRELS